MELVLFLLGVIGVTHILVESKLFQPVRDWFHDPYWPPFGQMLRTLFSFKWIAHMMGCNQCCGFWVGMFCGWLAFPDPPCGHIFLAGGAGSLLANSAAIILDYFVAGTIVHLDEKDAQ